MGVAARYSLGLGCSSNPRLLWLWRRLVAATLPGNYHMLWAWPLKKKKKKNKLMEKRVGKIILLSNQPKCQPPVVPPYPM